MKYLSVCSGIEAATTAWHPLGWEPVGFSEIEPFPSQVLAHHYPTVKNYGDMTQHEAWDIKPGSIDLLVGGTPCQSFSVAGLRQGLKDPRGNLSLTYLAIAARLRPRWIVWENVPGVLSSSGGRDLASFLGALGNLGYGWAYRVLDAQWVRTQQHPRAVPQRRRRIFVVGCLGDPTAAATVLFKQQSLLRNSKTRGTAREEIASDVEASTRVGCWWDGGDAADTLTKCGANGAQRMPDKDNFGAVLQPITVRSSSMAGFVEDTVGETMRATGGDCQGGSESLVLQPVPIQDGREINKQQNGIGVGQPGDPAYTLDTTGAQSVYTKAKRAQSDTDDETWVEGEVNPTLSLFDCGDVRATTIAIQAYSIREDAKANNFSATPTDVGLTVSALVPGVQSHHAQIFLAEAIPLDLRNSQRDPEKHDAQNRQGLGVGSVGDPAPTVDASFVHGVAHAFYSTGGTHGLNQQPEVCPAIKVGSSLGIPSPPAVVQCVAPTITAGNNPSRSPQSAEVTQQVAAVHAASMTVRRLTPRECERLQGFPDDYTLIPWRKKAAADCPDGPRYKALGNSMAVNCMEWIGERIAAFEAAE